MTEESKVTRHDIKVQPITTISRSSSFGTLAADYAKVTVIESNQTCTFTFFQSHPIAKIDQRGIILESIEEEMVLEVKMPLNAAFGLAIYMENLAKEFQGTPRQERCFFGPTAIKMANKPEEEKKS